MKVDVATILTWDALDLVDGTPSSVLFSPDIHHCTGGHMGDVHPLRPGTPVDPPDNEAPMYCRRPGCGNEVATKDRGRPAEFCSTRCQKRFPRDRAKAERALTHAQRVLEQYDQAPTPVAESPHSFTKSRTGAPADSTGVIQDPLPRTMAFALLAHGVEVATARLAQALQDPVAIEEIAADLALARKQAYRILTED